MIEGRPKRNNDRSVRKVVMKILGAVLLTVIAAGGWWAWNANKSGLLEFSVLQEPKPKPNLEKYEVLVAELARWRKDLGAKYSSATTNQERSAIEDDARLILNLVMPEMMRCWLGTAYDFNGTAEKPGQGKVACGYFVSTVIRDAGFKVNRYRLAQQPSENILRTFLPSESCRLRVGAEYNHYADGIEAMENGIYLVGLDTHVGFIVNRPDGLRFFHASGNRPWTVVEETRENAGALKRSNWRMIGGLTGEPSVVRTWLRNDKVIVRK